MNNNRVRVLNAKEYSRGSVVYWMSRDQRVADNWALLYAQELAMRHNTTFSVVFCIRPRFAHATERLVDFMLGGLIEVEEELRKKNIPFHLIVGDPIEKISAFLRTENAGALVCDFSPLRYNRVWKESLAKTAVYPIYEVDAHNIVPVWEASSKQEFGAYTLRPKMHRLLPKYLDSFPSVQVQQEGRAAHRIEWDAVRRHIHSDNSVKKVTWIKPGAHHARAALFQFIDNRLSQYAADRNDPTKHAQSDLSPYIHFGHISAQRIVLEVGEVRGMKESKDAFLEELIVRRELSDNYCYYNPHYDTPRGFPAWAAQTIAAHAQDTREHTYSLAELEDAKTHDELWNAAQREMKTRGKMHGYLRMYWAKKIFEWSASVSVAQKHAIHLNDRYFLDGRDPNGYTGIAWSMGGVHDRAWFERPVFGKIRYMNYNGAKSKFDVKKYIAEWS